MAQDAIILYENGKAIGGEGHPTDADEITFDNTGTDIVANKVGSAIKEVNAKFDREYVSVTGNGVKTIGTLLNELASLVDFSKITINSVLALATNIIPIVSIDGTVATYSYNYAMTTSPYQRTLTANIKSNDSNYLLFNGSATASQNNVVANNGTIIALYY